MSDYKQVPIPEQFEKQQVIIATRDDDDALVHITTYGATGADSATTTATIVATFKRHTG
jgi:hypothetical protein